MQNAYQINDVNKRSNIVNDHLFTNFFNKIRTKETEIELNNGNLI